MSEAVVEDAVLKAPTLQRVDSFGSNPGALDMHLFVPSGTARRRPLVVVLHGCTQTASGYDEASGWSRLAERHDFVLVYPEQRVANNRQTCFSWFEPADTTRGSGEVESIRQMIDYARDTCGVDARRIYVCGLSAGGAMAGALLAIYPELFRGGAIIAGLPFGTACNVREALDSMASGRIKDAKTWGDLVRGASTDDITGSGWRGPWPAISIWHGTEDRVVKPINGGELVKQWANVHAIAAVAPEEDVAGRTCRRIWRDPDGRDCVTHYSVAGLGHGAPVDDVDPPAPFFLPAGVSSTWQIARDWGLTARDRSRGLRSLFNLRGAAG